MNLPNARAAFFLSNLGSSSRGLDQTVVRLVRHVVLQYVEDETLFNRLSHAVQMKGLGLSVCPYSAKCHQCLVLWSRGERKKLMFACRPRRVMAFSISSS